MKLFKNFSLEDLLIKIFVPDSNKPKIVDPFDLVIKDNNVKKKDKKIYNDQKKSG